MELKATDLRVGNWVNNNEEHYQITSATIAQLERGDSTAKPIQLTEEWLVKFGFVKSPANNSIYLSVPELKAEVHFEDFRGALVCVLYWSTGSFIPNDIKYVHNIQNLYHALTGQEL